MTNAQGGNLLEVAPFAGAWIEIGLKQKPPQRRDVAPFAGAWIEILRFR